MELGDYQGNLWLPEDKSTNQLGWKLSNLKFTKKGGFCAISGIWSGRAVASFWFCLSSDLDARLPPSRSIRQHNLKHLGWEHFAWWVLQPSHLAIAEELWVEKRQSYVAVALNSWHPALDEFGSPKPPLVYCSIITVPCLTIPTVWRYK